LVEDEALVAMMIQDTLAEFGFRVIGPLSTASEALAAARESHFDAAVLDINLGDGLVYTVAEILGVRGVPFVFVTGYDVDSVDRGSVTFQPCKTRSSETCYRRSSCRAFPIASRSLASYFGRLFSAIESFIQGHKKTGLRRNSDKGPPFISFKSS